MMPWAQVQSGALPVGGLIFYAGELGDASSIGTTTQAALEAMGWLVCDGRSLPADIYSVLFAAIGHRYGGSGAQFCLPDYRGGTPFGASAGGGGQPSVLIKYMAGDDRGAGAPRPVSGR